MKGLPEYPIYIISKGRFDCCLTAHFFIKDKVNFHIVVEPQEAEEYTKRFGKERVLVLPFSNLGLGSIPVRNWVWDHSIKNGHKRHWIFDDNIRQIMRRYRGKRIPCNTNVALKVAEDFTNRYENIGISGLNYSMFVIDQDMAPFYLNNHVYSCLLILNSMPFRWRGRYNEDTDLCLQVLSGGLCTVLFNAFMIQKAATMTMKGGNTAELYKGDGRLKMSRSLEKRWPGVVTTVRKFSRPQHQVKDNWEAFDTKLIRRKDIDWDNLKPNEYGMKLTQVKKIKSVRMKSLLKQYNKGEKK